MGLHATRHDGDAAISTSPFAEPVHGPEAAPSTATVHTSGGLARTRASSLPCEMPTISAAERAAEFAAARAPSHSSDGTHSRTPSSSSTMERRARSQTDGDALVVVRAPSPAQTPSSVTPNVAAAAPEPSISEVEEALIQAAMRESLLMAGHAAVMPGLVNSVPTEGSVDVPSDEPDGLAAAPSQSNTDSLTRRPRQFTDVTLQTLHSDMEVDSSSDSDTE